MSMLATLATVALATVATPQDAVSPQEIPSPDRLYGRITTTDGASFEGFIRWDRNEGSWSDILNGSKQLPVENRRQAERLAQERRAAPEERERTIRFLGLKISWTEDGGRRGSSYASSASSGLRFGHIRSIEPTGSDRARITLRTGERVELRGGSTDIGTDSRGIEVEDAVRGKVGLDWRDIERVEFMAPPPGARPAHAGERLYGTLRTRRGDEFTGFVAWDVDEIFTTDVLDGEEGGRDREVPFEGIAAIERYSSSAANVRLRNGEAMVLRGSNDVNSSNRGITISDPHLGEVSVGWDEFDVLTFEPVPAQALYDRFDGGRRLRGSVRTADGRTLVGFIRWDNDEEWSWELLDGRSRGVDMDVEFGEIQSIEKASSRSAFVELRDGRTFEMDGSNDVNESNKGIFVTSEGGETVMVRWSEFRDVVFSRR
ncbi:MAG TPA: hypothetical protein VMK65_12960 [Longimicrobiales bacterium]|nr:hypothetical protein [Longimicrobiales bacterium]